MLQSEFYLGLPNEIWNNFLIEVEDILSEEEIGTHLVGVYPSGSRIYGIESASPEFICLYIDSPEVILNPYIIHHPDNETGYWKKTVKLDGSKITFIHLFDWVQWLIHRSTKNSRKLMEMHDIIPCNQDIAYQDESINDLLLMAREYIKNVPALCSINYEKHLMSYQEKLEYCLYIRTQFVKELTGRFAPNLNPNWNKVIDIEVEEDTDLYKIDKLIQETILKNNNRVLDKDLDIYSWEIWKKLYKKKETNNTFFPNIKLKDTSIINKLAEEISKETMRIYRYIL